MCKGLKFQGSVDLASVETTNVKVIEDIELTEKQIHYRENRKLTKSKSLSLFLSAKTLSSSYRRSAFSKDSPTSSKNNPILKKNNPVPLKQL